MFERFPKTRPPLPRDMAAIYASHYKSNREGNTAAASLAQRLEAWMHERVADDTRRPGERRVTLEIGAGTLNQLAYEPETGPYDIVEPFADLYAGSPRLGRIRNLYADIADVPADVRYDRIISVAAFEHVLDLPRLVARCGLLLAEGGTLRVAIPSEGTVLWAMGWKLTTGLEFRLRHGLDYGLLMRHEHVNDAAEIADILDYFFEDMSSRCFGLVPALSLYQFHACSRPRLDRCRAHGEE